MASHPASDPSPESAGSFDLAGHSFRVAAYAVELGRQVGLDGATLHTVFMGGLLHDIGKLFLPAGLLTHPGPLPGSAALVVRRHPELGRDFLLRSGAAKTVVEVVYGHHEHWNGGGYPRGLRQDGIPLGARLVAIADTYDAIRSHRVYRAGRSHGRAMFELEQAAGAQLDPNLVECFTAVPTTIRERIGDMHIAPEVVERLLTPASAGNTPVWADAGFDDAWTEPRAAAVPVAVR